MQSCLNGDTGGGRKCPSMFLFLFWGNRKMAACTKSHPLLGALQAKQESKSNNMWACTCDMSESFIAGYWAKHMHIYTDAGYKDLLHITTNTLHLYPITLFVVWSVALYLAVGFSFKIKCFVFKSTCISLSSGFFLKKKIMHKLLYSSVNNEYTNGEGTLSLDCTPRQNGVF